MPPEHSRAREFLAGVGSTRDAWYVTDGILYEFLRVVDPRESVSKTADVA